MIQSENIRLRAVEPSDVDRIFNWENDSNIWHLSNTLLPFSRFDIEQYVINADKDIYASRQLRLMIDFLQADNNYKTIGCVDLFDFEPQHRRAGIGILIEKENRENGYASETLDLLTKYTSEILNLHQLYCNIESVNNPSLNLFKKKHFEIIGVKRDWNLRNNQWVDEYLLQRIF